MKIAYKDNGELGPGHGILVFSEDILPGSPWSVSIQRASDQKYASGKSGNPWVGEALAIPAQGEVSPDGSLRIFIGPEIVDLLDQLDQYKVTVKGSDGDSATARLKIDTITRSPAQSLGNMGAAPKPAQAPPPPPPPPVTEAHDKPLTMNSPQQGAPERVPESKKSHRALRYIFIGLLAAICAAWFLFDYLHKRDSEETPANAKPAVAETKKSVQRGSEEQVREFFAKQDITPELALELAKRLPKDSAQDQDAVYRLYYYAAEKDAPAALMEYAACLDPSRKQWGTIRKNAPIADIIYKKAASLGVAGAQEAANSLKSWLESQAKAGNAQASRWLEEMPH